MKTSAERQRLYRERLQKNGKKQLLITIDSDVYNSLVNGAQGEGVTINELVNETLSGGVIPKSQPELIKKGGAKRESKYHRFAMEKAKAAIAELKQVRYDHPGREQALDFVKEWINQHSIAPPEKKFLQAYDAFQKEAFRAKDNKWKDVSFTLVCDKIGDLNWFTHETL